MERRKLLQAITAIPAMVIAGKGGQQVGVKYEVSHDKKYIVFVNPSMVDMEEFCKYEESLPPGTFVHAVYPLAGQSMDEAIRIFEIEGGDPSPRT